MKTKPTTEEKIAKLKQFCWSRYNDGCDVMIECWDAKDYDDLLKQVGGNYNKALAEIKVLAGINRERNEVIDASRKRREEELASYM